MHKMNPNKIKAAFYAIIGVVLILGVIYANYIYLSNAWQEINVSLVKAFVLYVAYFIVIIEASLVMLWIGAMLLVEALDML